MEKISMKKFLLVILMLIMAVSSVYGNSLQDTSIGTGKKNETTELLALLPDSDIVITMDIEKLQATIPKNNPFFALNNRIALTFLGSDKFAFGDIESVKSTIDIEAGKEPGLLEKNQQLVTYISNLNADNSVRFAVLEFNKITAEMRKQTELANKNTKDCPDSAGPSSAEKALNSIKGLYGSLDVSNGFKIDLNMDIQTEGEASEISGSINATLAVGKQALAGQAQKDPKQAKLLEVVNQTIVENSDKNVRIVVNLSQQLTDELLNMIKDSFRN
jgi:hypothetical protein